MAAYTLPAFTSGQVNTILKVGTVIVQTGMTFNTATTFLAVVFVASVSQNMTGFKVSCRLNTGTPSGARADLFAVDANGKPTGSSLANVTFTPTSNTINTESWGAAVALTAGTAYAIVFQNTTATPASNTYGLNLAVNDYLGNIILVSTNSGSNWSNTGVSTYGSAMVCPVYATLGSDAMLYVTSQTGGAALQLFNTSASRVAREAIKWNCPHDVILWKANFQFQANTGSPTHFLQAEVCSAAASLSVSDVQVDSSLIVNGAFGQFQWNAGVTLSANTDYYIGPTPVGATAGNSSNTPRLVINAGMLKPATFGPLVDAYDSTASPGPSFSQLATGVPMAEFWFTIPQASGGGLLAARGMSGGLN